MTSHEQKKIYNTRKTIKQSNQKQIKLFAVSFVVAEVFWYSFLSLHSSFSIMDDPVLFSI